MRTFVSSVICIFILSACNNPSDPQTETFESGVTAQENKEIKEVIYSMYLPTDMTMVFQRSGKNYDPGIPAPIEDMTLYEDPEQIAVMLGVYGVDISYMKMLDQAAPASRYYNTLKTLADRISLPASIFDRASEQMEKYFNTNDTLANVIQDIYRETDRYFKKTSNDNLAALSLFGGWVEAMYIGSRIYASDPGNIDLAEKLLQQKYSLNSIYTVLRNHQESLAVRSYLLMLKKLRKSYDAVEIRYQKEGFSVDTTQKKIQGYSAEISYDEQTMEDIISIIHLIREELIRTGTKKA